MIKLTINGFDIEVIEDNEEISVKIIDASGKELSNNLYNQSKEGDIDNEVELESPEIEDMTDDEELEEMPDFDEVETDEVETDEEETVDEVVDEELDESLLMVSFQEYFEKQKNKYRD